MNLFVKIGKVAIFAFGLFFLTLSFSLTAHGQTPSLRITTIPKYPGPFEDVSITVEDFSRDLNKVEITWTANSKVIQKGKGLKQAKIKTGAIGTATNISINMGGVTRQVSIKPTAVDLIWQSDTFTPPFYKGKALHTSQDPITVVAEPFFVTSKGERLDPNNLIYKWKQDEKISNNASGPGKRTFKVTPSVLPKDINIEVEVSSTDGAYKGLAEITIPNSSPKVVFYENQPLYGVNFNRAIGQGGLSLLDDTRIIAAPYFFSKAQKDLGLLSYEWTLNGRAVTGVQDEVILTKPENGVSGRSTVSVSIKNLEKFLQADSSSFIATFNANTTSGAMSNPNF